MKLTPTRTKQVEMLSDGKWHNVNNNGIRGLAFNSLDALVNKGVVEEKNLYRLICISEKNGSSGLHSVKTSSPDPETVADPYYDVWYRLTIDFVPNKIFGSN